MLYFCIYCFIIGRSLFQQVPPLSLTSLKKTATVEIAKQLSELASDGTKCDEEKAESIGAILVALNNDIISDVFFELRRDYMNLLNISTIMAIGYARSFSN